MVRSTRITRRHNRSHKRSTTLHRRRYGKGRRRVRSGRARVVTRKGRVRRRWMRGGVDVMTRPSFNDKDVSAREDIANILYKNLEIFKINLLIVPYKAGKTDPRVYVCGTLQRTGEGFFQERGVYSKRWLQIYGVTDVTVAATADAAAAAAALAAGVPSAPKLELSTNDATAAAAAVAAGAAPSAPYLTEFSINYGGAGQEVTAIPNSLNAAAAAPPEVFVFVYSRTEEMTEPKVIFLDHIEAIDAIDPKGSLADGTEYRGKRILVLTYKDRFKHMSPTGNKVIKFTSNDTDEFIKKWFFDEPQTHYWLHNNVEKNSWIDSTNPDSLGYTERWTKERRSHECFINEWFKALTLYVRRALNASKA